MRKKLWAALALTMVIVGAALVWGLGGVSRVTASAFSLDLERLRAAALASGEPLPLAMGEHVIAFGDFPKGAVIAGESLLDQQRLVFRTHVLGYADGRTVVIDPVHGADLHEKFYGQGFNPRAWAVMQDALVRSSLVLVTHEHFDHVAGIAQASNFSAVRDKVMLSREQLLSDAIEEAGFSEEQLNQLASFDYDDYYSPAPGIALKKAPGHSPGSQMIFVRFADGNEVLFVGDVAWSWQNLLEERGRPRFVSALIGEDGVSVAAQLATLRALFLKGEVSSAVPSGVQLVISHEMRPHTD
jgi:glyoxylase-like metal-dependent hydrolase (beta-lactamase superfamily II)